MILSRSFILSGCDMVGKICDGEKNSPIYIHLGGRWSSGKYVGTCLRAAGSSPAPPAVWGGTLASDKAYGVVRQGFDPGLQVVLCQQ
jgi:hypothetical protein